MPDQDLGYDRATIAFDLDELVVVVVGRAHLIVDERGVEGGIEEAVLVVLDHPDRR